MPALARRIGMNLVWLCLIACQAQHSRAQARHLTQTATTWWPDPTTGLMWTGQAAEGPKMHGLNWQQAKDYCASLQLGGYSTWRLPTVDEVKAILYLQQMIPINNPPYDVQVFKGIISGAYAVWTSEPSGAYEAWVIALDFPPQAPSALSPALLADRLSAVCTSPMPPDLLQIAKDAQVVSPVPDVATLKANIPLAKAQQAYQARQYQQSIAQAQSALLVKPDFAQAYWAIGISYGMLGQWDMSITNLETALKIDKNYADAKDSLKWAKDSQKAARKGKTSKILSPQWTWTLEPPVCFRRWLPLYEDYTCVPAK